MHTCIHVYMYTTCIHVYMYTCTHTHIYIYKHSSTQTWMVWYWTWHTLQVSTPLTPYIACFWRARSPWSTRIIWSPMRAQPSWAGNLVFLLVVEGMFVLGYGYDGSKHITIDDSFTIKKSQMLDPYKNTFHIKTLSQSNYLLPYDWLTKHPVSSSYDLLGTAQIPRGWCTAIVLVGSPWVSLIVMG